MFCQQDLKVRSRTGVKSMTDKGVQRIIAVDPGEVIASCAPEDVEEVKKIMQECMTVSDYVVEITAGPEGPIDRWGSKY